jgi:Fibrinogen beta and gamma chains, C-terminal globular domain
VQHAEILIVVNIKLLSSSYLVLQVIQRRDEFGEPRENFNRDWADYKNGFGDPGKEFWLGNENIYMLTNNEDYALRVELEDFEGNKR